MGRVIDFLTGKKRKRFEAVEKKIQGARHHLHIGGLKGEALFPKIRGATVNVRFKRIQQGETTVEKDLADFNAFIEKHMVVNAEDEDIKALQMIIKEYMRMNYNIHSMMLYEKRDLEKFGEFVDRLKAFCQKKGVDEFTRKNIADILDEIADGWKKDIEHLRQMLNSVFQTAQGDSGWALSAFNKMHNEGFFIRFQERKHFRDALNNEKKVEKALSTVEHFQKIRSIDELKNLVASVKKEEKEMAYDFDVVYKMILNSWNHITELMAKLLQITTAAANAHELPASIVEDMGKLHNMIVKNLDEEYLRNLRIDDKQLEAIYSDVSSKIKGVRKAS